MYALHIIQKKYQYIWRPHTQNKHSTSIKTVKTNTYIFLQNGWRELETIWSKTCVTY